jgi:hypothetical protein
MSAIKRLMQPVVTLQLEGAEYDYPRIDTYGVGAPTQTITITATSFAELRKVAKHLAWELSLIADEADDLDKAQARYR